MPITASRFGSAPLLLDWSLLGSAPPVMDVAKAQTAWDKLKSRFNDKDVGFYQAPIDDSVSQIAASQKLAAEILSESKNSAHPLQDILVLGIGGSALGPLSLLSSLQDRTTSTPKFHFVENPDALEWKSTLLRMNPVTTLVVVITKSGSTFETLAQFLLALEWLGADRITKQVIGITDPTKGDLRKWVTENKVRSLEIAPSLGGRFSIFSPVGLFIAALAGLNTDEFILGARQMRDYCEKTPVEKNPLMICGTEFVRLYPQKASHVCMPYSTRLRTLGDWFVQLWGESLGKDGKGFTPLAAVGATDQHSILQLLRDGPNDKITFFITVDKVTDPCAIAPSRPKDGVSHLDAFRILQGHSLHDLLRFEYQAISRVLANQNRPNLTFTLDEINERSLGALYFAFSVLTAFTGTYWGVEPFDQPGVEEGKVYIRNFLSQANRQPTNSGSGGAYASAQENAVERLRNRMRDDY